MAKLLFRHGLLVPGHAKKWRSRAQKGKRCPGKLDYQTPERPAVVLAPTAVLDAPAATDNATHPASPGTPLLPALCTLTPPALLSTADCALAIAAPISTAGSEAPISPATSTKAALSAANSEALTTPVSSKEAFSCSSDATPAAVAADSDDSCSLDSACAAESAAVVTPTAPVSTTEVSTAHAAAVTSQICSLDSPRPALLPAPQSSLDSPRPMLLPALKVDEPEKQQQDSSSPMSPIAAFYGSSSPVSSPAFSSSDSHSSSMGCDGSSSADSTFGGSSSADGSSADRICDGNNSSADSRTGPDSDISMGCDGSSRAADSPLVAQQQLCEEAAPVCEPDAAAAAEAAASEAEAAAAAAAAASEAFGMPAGQKIGDALELLYEAAESVDSLADFTHVNVDKVEHPVLGSVVVKSSPVDMDAQLRVEERAAQHLPADSPLLGHNLLFWRDTTRSRSYALGRYAGETLDEVVSDRAATLDCLFDDAEAYQAARVAMGLPEELQWREKLEREVEGLRARQFVGWMANTVLIIKELQAGAAPLCYFDWKPQNLTYDAATGLYCLIDMGLATPMGGNQPSTIGGTPGFYDPAVCGRSPSGALLMDTPGGMQSLLNPKTDITLGLVTGLKLLNGTFPGAYSEAIYSLADAADAETATQQAAKEAAAAAILQWATAAAAASDPGSLPELQLLSQQPLLQGLIARAFSPDVSQRPSLQDFLACPELQTALQEVRGAVQAARPAVQQQVKAMRLFGALIRPEDVMQGEHDEQQQQKQQQGLNTDASDDSFKQQEQQQQQDFAIDDATTQHQQQQGLNIAAVDSTLQLDCTLQQQQHQEFDAAAAAAAAAAVADTTTEQLQQEQQQDLDIAAVDPALQLDSSLQQQQHQEFDAAAAADTITQQQQQQQLSFSSSSLLSGPGIHWPPHSPQAAAVQESFEPFITGTGTGSGGGLLGAGLGLCSTNSSSGGSVYTCAGAAAAETVEGDGLWGAGDAAVTAGLISFSGSCVDSIVTPPAAAAAAAAGGLNGSCLSLSDSVVTPVAAAAATTSLFGCSLSSNGGAGLVGCGSFGGCADLALSGSAAGAGLGFGGCCSGLAAPGEGGSLGGSLFGSLAAPLPEANWGFGSCSGDTAGGSLFGRL